MVISSFKRDVTAAAVEDSLSVQNVVHDVCTHACNRVLPHLALERFSSRQHMMFASAFEEAFVLRLDHPLVPERVVLANAWREWDLAHARLRRLHTRFVSRFDDPIEQCADRL